MSLTEGPASTQKLIDALVQSTGAPDASSAIRGVARATFQRYRLELGEPTVPVNMEALASFLGISISSEHPGHSLDAELHSQSDGRVSIRVNRDRPESRKRFSIGHEISHTFFPNYKQKTWCRTDSRYRRRDNPDQQIEMLCDVAAAELAMPLPWFTDDAAAVNTGQGLVDLALKYGVSREACLRRFAEMHSSSVAALFLSWKLKPVQQSTIGNRDQSNLFGTDPQDDARRAKKLRIDYSIPSRAFAAAHYYLPPDKSVENDGPLYKAASLGSPFEGECLLDIGVSGSFRVLAVFAPLGN